MLAGYLQSCRATQSSGQGPCTLCCKACPGLITLAMGCTWCVCVQCTGFVIRGCTCGCSPGCVCTACNSACTLNHAGTVTRPGVRGTLTPAQWRLHVTHGPDHCSSLLCADLCTQLLPGGEVACAEPGVSKAKPVPGLVCTGTAAMYGGMYHLTGAQHCVLSTAVHASVCLCA
jgi:hypothetical protein